MSAIGRVGKMLEKVTGLVIDSPAADYLVSVDCSDMGFAFSQSYVQGVRQRYCPHRHALEGCMRPHCFDLSCDRAALTRSRGHSSVRCGQYRCRTPLDVTLRERKAMQNNLTETR